MNQNELIIIDKKARELLQHNITNSLSIIVLSLNALKKRNDKEIYRIEAQIDRIEEVIKRLSSN